MDVLWEPFFKAVGNYAFPIVVTGYLLIRMENKIDKMIDSFQELKEEIMSLVQLLKDRKR